MYYYGNPEYPPDINMITVKVFIKSMLHQPSGRLECGNYPAGKE